MDKTRGNNPAKDVCELVVKLHSSVTISGSTPMTACMKKKKRQRRSGSDGSLIPCFARRPTSTVNNVSTLDRKRTFVILLLGQKPGAPHRAPPLGPTSAEKPVDGLHDEQKPRVRTYASSSQARGVPCYQQRLDGVTRFQTLDPRPSLSRQ